MPETTELTTEHSTRLLSGALIETSSHCLVATLIFLSIETYGSEYFILISRIFRFPERRYIKIINTQVKYITK